MTRLVPGIVSSVTDMDGMFREATSFNRPIETWNVSMLDLCQICLEMLQHLINL